MCVSRPSFPTTQPFTLNQAPTNHGGLTMEGQLPGRGDERGRPNGPKGSFAFKLSMIYLHKRREVPEDYSN